MRRQRPRGTITQQAVVSAGLTIVDHARVAGLTIRGVAREVGAPPMSLYSHFSNKDELLDLMYAELVRRLYTDSGHDTWQAELFTLCQHIRVVLLEHPNWTELLARPAAPLDIPVRERILGMMVADGMTPTVAFAALAGAALSSTGFVLAELNLRNPAGASSIHLRYERLHEWQELGLESPVTRSAVAEAPKFDIDAVFLFALRSMVRGFAPAHPPTDRVISRI